MIANGGLFVPPHVFGDPNQLQQVLLNLLQNAVKFTHEGDISLMVSSVTRIDEQQNHHPGHITLHFVMADMGIGFCADQWELIFDKSQQGNTSTAHNYRGTGLGLPICKLLVKAMVGGMIGVESEDGTGSKLWLEVPFASSPPPIDQVESLAIIKHSQLAACDETRSLSILLINDNQVNQKVMSAMLK